MYRLLTTLFSDAIAVTGLQVCGRIALQLTTIKVSLLKMTLALVVIQSCLTLRGPLVFMLLFINLPLCIWIMIFRKSCGCEVKVFRCNANLKQGFPLCKSKQYLVIYIFPWDVSLIVFLAQILLLFSQNKLSVMHPEES